MEEEHKLGWRRIWAHIWRRGGFLSSSQSRLIHETTHLINDLRLEVWYVRRELGELSWSCKDASDVQYKKDLEKHLQLLIDLEQSMILLADKVAAECKCTGQFDGTKLLPHIRLVRLLLSWH